MTLTCTFDFLGNCTWEHNMVASEYPVTIENGNNTTVCSVKIANTNQIDSGAWRCIADSRIYSLNAHLRVITEKGKILLWADELKWWRAMRSLSVMHDKQHKIGEISKCEVSELLFRNKQTKTKI